MIDCSCLTSTSNKDMNGCKQMIPVVRREYSAFTRVGVLPTHPHKIDYFLNPHLDPNRASRPRDRDRVWDPKTRRLSRSDQLDTASGRREPDAVPAGCRSST
eukprot:763215-Hanusia_phi.AAC.1